MIHPSQPVMYVTAGVQPAAVAIAGDKFACVVNESDGTVSIFDVFNPLAAPTTVTVGNDPVAIAIADNKYACVTNQGDGTVSVFDVTNPPTGVAPTVTVGLNPGPIAIFSPSPKVKRPAQFYGKIERHGHWASLHMKWNESPSPNITHYEIFAFHKPIASIPVGVPLKFNRKIKSPFLSHKHLPHRFIHSLNHKYRIRAVNQDGGKSEFRRLEVKE